MYIEDKRVMANTTYGELLEGECFIVEDYIKEEEILCIKVCIFDDCDNPCYYAVVLETGSELLLNDDTVISKDTPVAKVNARITFW